MKGLLLLPLLATLLLIGCERKVSAGIEGKWTMPQGGFMGYSLSLTASGDYTRWFWSDVVIPDDMPENPKKGAYTFAEGWLAIPVTYRWNGRSHVFHDRFKRETINGIEVLLREDAEAIWRRSGMIHTGGLLIKISDDPGYTESKNEPCTKRLFRNGVERWSQEAEAAKGTNSAGAAVAGPPPAAGFAESPDE